MIRTRLSGGVAAAALALATALGGTLLGAADADAQTTVRLAHHLPTTAEQHQAAEVFAAEVAERTGGELQVEILHSAQLGGQREVIEGVSFGTVEMGFGESGLYASYVPQFSVISLPYLYTGHDHWIEVVDGPVGETLAEALLDNSGMRIINWMITGYRDTYLRNHPIETPEDFVGVRVRLPEAPVFVQAFDAVGAIPTPIPAPEMYTALQTGVVDAMEGTPDVGYTWKMFEVTSYLSMTRHILLDGSFIINEDFFQSLSEEHRQAILDAGQAAAEAQRAGHIEREREYLEKLRTETDLQINEVDLSAFAEAVRPLHDRVAEEIGAVDLLAQIKAAAN
jgi:tripartite ATP-independent transporter DctP family solute receptor